MQVFYVGHSGTLCPRQFTPCCTWNCSMLESNPKHIVTLKLAGLFLYLQECFVVKEAPNFSQPCSTRFYVQKRTVKVWVDIIRFVSKQTGKNKFPLNVIEIRVNVE